MRHTILLIAFLVVGLTFSKAHAQTIIDSTGNVVDSASIKQAAIDSIKNIHSPRKASIRSALFPGLGQIYNKSYWKLPIIYGALGTTAYIFVDNLKTYKELRFAYGARFRAALPMPDSADYKRLKPLYQNPNVQLEQIKYQRDEFRRYLDYTVLVFAVFWALNIVDATVDAHLKSFDVSPDLGLRFKAGYSDMARTNGISLVLSLK